MSPASVVGALATATGVMTALAPLLQVRRIRLLGNSAEVSAGAYAVIAGNGIVAAVYGGMTAEPVIGVPNAVVAFTAGLTVITVYRYRFGRPVL